MKQLNDVITKLQTDPFFAITAEYQDSFDKWISIERNASGQVLIAKYGGVTNFFENLKAKGITTVQICPKKQNGTTKEGKTNYKPAPGMNSFIYDVNPTPNAVPTPTAVQSKPTALEAVPMSNFGMMGVGMSMPEMYYKTMDHARLVGEVTRLQAKVDSLEVEKADLKEKDLQHKYATDKSSNNLDILKQFAPALNAIMTAKMGGGAAPEGLGHPAENLSPAKSTFMTIVRQADDSFLEDLYLVVQGMQNDDFSNELDELITKYNLKNPIQNAS